MRINAVGFLLDTWASCKSNTKLGKTTTLAASKQGKGLSGMPADRTGRRRQRNSVGEEGHRQLQGTSRSGTIWQVLRAWSTHRKERPQVCIIFAESPKETSKRLKIQLQKHILLIKVQKWFCLTFKALSEARIDSGRKWLLRNYWISKVTKIEGKYLTPCDSWGKNLTPKFVVFTYQ